MSLLRKRNPFLALALVALAGYGVLPLIFPLLGQYDRTPLQDIRSFAPGAGDGLAYALLFLLLYAVYYAVWRHASLHGARRWQIFIPVLLFCLPLLLTYPINATDLFRYFVRGRVTAFYGESSFAMPPSAFPDDPFLPLAGQWATATSPYGPLWERLAATVTVLSGQRLLPGLLIFKAMAIAAHLGTGYVIWRAAEKRAKERQAAATVLWLWNPALLYMFVMDGHNDALMIFWLALGYLLQKQRPLLGIYIAALGALTKPIGVLVLPFLVLFHWRRQDSWRARWRYFLLATGGSLVLAFAAFVPFGSPLQLAVRLVTEASASVGFSPGVLFVLVGQRLTLLADVELAVEIGTAASLSLFGLLTLLLLWRTWRGMPVTKSIAATFAAYLVLAFTFRIWYSAWPFLWLILDRDGDRRWLSAGFWFLLTAHLSVIVYGHLRVYALAGDLVVAHLIGVPFTFVLPLLLARRLPLPRLEDVDPAPHPTPAQ